MLGDGSWPDGNIRSKADMALWIICQKVRISCPGCHNHQGHFIFIHISEENCISVREEVLNTAKYKICGKKPLLLCLMLLFQMSCSEKRVMSFLELVFIKSLFGSDELMVLSPGK